eukprot:GHVU01079878.1.p2 GENE.GHVU01079878.1~~GHVU01079878.1.p2  ORF type:complete len:120 (+),score=3.32 GHVU01079878.1:424-783(+)
MTSDWLPPFLDSRNELLEQGSYACDSGPSIHVGLAHTHADRQTHTHTHTQANTHAGNHTHTHTHADTLRNASARAPAHSHLWKHRELSAPTVVTVNRQQPSHGCWSMSVCIGGSNGAGW